MHVKPETFELAVGFLEKEIKRTAAMMLKMVDGSEFDVAKRTTASTKLNEDDELLIVHAMTGEETVVMQSEKEMFLRIEASTIPEKKKGAVGVRGMKLNAEVRGSYGTGAVCQGGQGCCRIGDEQVCHNSQTMPQVLFTWHGGETLMRPLSFYKKAMELQKKYARGRTIDNCPPANWRRADCARSRSIYACNRLL